MAKKGDGYNMKPIRVLHEVTIMNTGGIETLLMNIYRNINRQKVQFDFMLHRNYEGFYDKEIKLLGGKLYYGIPFNPLKQRKYINSLDDFFISHPEYKIIHAHNAFSMFTLRSALKLNVPIRIAHSHNPKPCIDLKYPFRQYCKFNLKRYCTNMFACSKQAGEWMFGRKSIKDDKVTIINNGIIPEKFIFDYRIRSKIRKRYDLQDKFVIGHVGRFNKQKNHEFLIDIFKKVHDKNTNAMLMLIGEGSLEKKIKDKAKKLGILSSIKFMGILSNVNECMQAMDVFVFPSLYEGLGIVTIEAQAAGLKCIVADTIPREAFITKYIESVSLKASSENWADVILKYSNGYERKDMHIEVGNAGYNIKEISNNLEKFYLTLLEKN